MIVKKATIDSFELYSNPLARNVQQIKLRLYEIEPINITKFLWGNESVYNAEDFMVLGGQTNELSITFEKSNENENLINKAIFKDETNRQEVAILLKSRVHSDDFIDLGKIWKLMLI